MSRSRLHETKHNPFLIVLAYFDPMKKHRLKLTPGFYLFLTFSSLPFVSIGQFQEIRALYESKEQGEETITWLCDTAFTFHTNNPVLAGELAELALKESESSAFGLGQAKAHHVLGISFWSRDLYSLSMEHFLQALDFYEESGNLKGIANISINIGNLQDDLRNHDQARMYLLKGLNYFQISKDSVGMYRAMNNLGVAYFHLQQFDSAIFFYKRSFELRLIKKDTVGVSRIYNNMGLVNLHLHNTEEAFRNLEASRTILHTHENLNLLTDVYANLGWAYAQQGNYKYGLLYLDSSLVLSQRINSLNGEQEAYKRMKEIAIENGDIERAYGLFVKEVELENRQRSAEISSQIEQMMEENRRAKQERKIAELEKERTEQAAFKKLLLAALVITLMIAGFFIYYVYSKYRRSRELSKIRLQELRKELDAKNKEISSYTLNFIQKSELMEDLKSQIDVLQKSEDPDNSKKLNRIGRIIDETFKIDQDWPMFIKTFEQMHDGFFAVLKEQFPDLSNSELKLCALLRLNMNMKETAKILGISFDSVKTARSRLRKKLGLKLEDNLVDFLIKFEQEWCVRV